LERLGLVVEHAANRTSVEADGSDANSGEWSCSMRGRLRQGRRERVRAAVIGDRVRFRVTDSEKREGVIEEILPRRNFISRPQPSGGSRRVLEQLVVANLDRLWVIVSLAEPQLNLRFVDRILAAARFQEVPAGVIFNKCDLAAAPDPEPIAAIYRALGLPVRVASASSGAGIEVLREDLRGSICAFVGLSGVGKSSLLRALQPGLDLRVQSVGEKHGHGRHTTSSSRLYRLEGSGYLADTPGMREFGMWGMYQKQLVLGFAELDAAADDCRFRDCLHGKEPGCAVREAVERGEIAASRYESYRTLLEELPFDELDKAGILKGPPRG